MNPTRAVCAAMLFAGALSACAEPLSTTTGHDVAAISLPRIVPPADFVPDIGQRLLEPQTFSKGRIRLSPPVAGAPAAITAIEAYSAVVESRIRSDLVLAGVPEKTYLIDFSDDDFGRSTEDLASEPSYQHVLAWAVMWRAATPVISGPRQRDGSVNTIPLSNCFSVAVVGAVTGAYLEGFDECRPE